MSGALKTWARHKRTQEKRKELPLSTPERRALQLLRQEAKNLGSFLTTGGKGGLQPSLVLTVLRRDEYKCKKCGQVGTHGNGGVTLHHKGGVKQPVSQWLLKKGKRNDTNNLVTLCHSCHDDIHKKDRELSETVDIVAPDADVTERVEIAKALIES